MGESGDPGARQANLIVLDRVARVLGCTLDELAPGLADEKAQVMRLLGQPDESRCFRDVVQVGAAVA